MIRKHVIADIEDSLRAVQEAVQNLTGIPVVFPTYEEEPEQYARFPNLQIAILSFLTRYRDDIYISMKLRKKEGKNPTLADLFALTDVCLYSYQDVLRRQRIFANMMFNMDVTDYTVVNRFPVLEKPMGKDEFNPFLNLRKLRGPVQYVFLDNEDSNVKIILLGDHHGGDMCTAACASDRCASLQVVKNKQSGPIRGMDMSFLKHLDDEYGHLKPDLYLESWMEDDVRHGKAQDGDDDGKHWRRKFYKPEELASLPAETVYNMGPLTAVEQYTRPCMVPSLRGTSACPYKNLRVHAVDPRMTDVKLWAPLHRLLRAVKQGTIGGAVEFFKWCKETHPDFTIEEVVRATLDPTPLASITHDFCKRNSRLYHEFRQLNDTLQRDLIIAIQDSTTMRPLPYDLATAVTGWLSLVVQSLGVPAPPISLHIVTKGLDMTLEAIARAELHPKVEEKLILHPLVASDLLSFWNNRMYTCRAMVDTNLYTIARMLKMSRDPAVPALHVVFMGWKHTEEIAKILITSGAFRARVAGSSNNKCMKFRFNHRRVPQAKEWKGATPIKSDKDADADEDDDGHLLKNYYESKDTAPGVLIIPQAPYGVLLSASVFSPWCAIFDDVIGDKDLIEYE